MTETEHLHLKKPGQGDYYNVDDFNGNADLIDTKLKEIDDSVAQPSGIATLDSSGKPCTDAHGGGCGGGAPSNAYGYHLC